MAASFRSPFLSALQERCFIHQITDAEGLDAAAAQGVTGYIGFDMTAPSLHVGSLVQIMMLRHLQRAGGKPIVLLGGGTTRVGDPSGKDESRRLLSEEEIEANAASIRTVFERFLRFGEGPTDAIMLNNADWLLKLGYIDFLRDVGRHFSVNRMLSMDSVRLRLDREQMLSFIEFNYMILQAYDFAVLNQRHGCRLQMGGSDQWGNIVNGVDLTRRMHGEDVFGLTTPLLTTASGAKMGKTAAGAIWLNAAMLSPFDYWQFWRNVEDADIGRFLKLFTDLPMDEIARLASLQGAEINEAKRVLATEATALLHGLTAAQAAQNTAAATFGGGGAGEALPTIDRSIQTLIGMRVADALRALRLVESNGEAKRHIKAGAVSVNNVPVASETATLEEADLIDGVVKLSVGKKKHGLVRRTQ
ncbi:MAG: tyrosine--tRNA ligase [Alphaproteobacteria bacterium]|nr:tyrosine--tRNA ligase [Alphaproteobacteria bacterium]